jgi:hypothetical protein
MTDEQIAALLERGPVARLRTFVQRNGHNDMAVTTLDTYHARVILAHIDALAAEIERLREEPTLTITREMYDEFVESAEDHTVLWTDTLALIGVYVAPCQTKIDVQHDRSNKGNDNAAQ